MPFITEEIYQMYFAKKEKNKSIHIASWPMEIKVNKKIEATGDRAIEIISEVRKFKAKNQLSLKTEISLRLEKADEKTLKPFLQDIKAVTSAREINFGSTLSVEL